MSTLQEDRRVPVSVPVRSATIMRGTDGGFDLVLVGDIVGTAGVKCNYKKLDVALDAARKWVGEPNWP